MILKISMHLKKIREFLSVKNKECFFFLFTFISTVDLSSIDSRAEAVINVEA